MQKINIKKITWISFVLLLLSACSKDNTGLDVQVSYQFIADKTWYLDYAQTTTGTTTNTRTYLGQPTYFINYLKNLSTTDSDGLIGVYSIKQTGNKLQIQVAAKTLSGNNSNYTYEIESLGARNMILSYVNNNVTTQLFFSTQK